MPEGCEWRRRWLALFIPIRGCYPTKMGQVPPFEGKPEGCEWGGRDAGSDRSPHHVNLHYQMSVQRPDLKWIYLALILPIKTGFQPINA